MRVSLTPLAVGDASESRRWYAERSPRSASAFVAELERAIDSLAEAPLRWPPYLHGTRRLLLRRFPFGIVYRVGVDEIQVIAIVHLHRRPGFWGERLRSD